MKIILVWFLTLGRFYQAAIVGAFSAATAAWLSYHGWIFLSTLCSAVALYAFIDAWRNRNAV